MLFISFGPEMRCFSSLFTIWYLRSFSQIVILAPKDTSFQKGFDILAKLVSFMMFATTHNIQNANGGLVQQLSGPTVVLRPKYIPSEFSFAIAIGINGVDLHNDNTTQIIFRSPSNAIILDTGKAKILASDTDSNLPPEFQGFVMTMPLQNITFDTEGVYSLEVFMNDELLDTRAIPVFRQGDI